MSQSRNKPLLSDVLAEDSDSEFRAALLDQTLHMVRRKRRIRKARNAVYASLMIAAVALASFHFLFSKPPISKRFEPSYLLVTTEPLPVNAALSTTQDRSVAVISSLPAVEIDTVATSQNTGVLRQLDDDELLALLPSPALLVRRGPHLAELVFADSATNHTLFPN
jgi:hypothetical protein